MTAAYEEAAAGLQWLDSHLSEFELPVDCRFSDLQVSRTPQGALQFSAAAMERACSANGLIFAALSADEVSTVIAWWYAEHRATGGAADPVLEQLLQESIAEQLRPRR